MKRTIIILALFLVTSLLLFYSCATTNESQFLEPSSTGIKTPFDHDSSISDVILFDAGRYGCKLDLKTYKKFADQLGYSSKMVDYNFINNKDSFFDKNKTKRKFGVLILPGGEPYRWFAQTVGRGINCEGVKNILEFIKSGGSVIAICYCGSVLFSKSFDWQNPTLKDAQAGHWGATKQGSGWFKRFCRVYAFKGTMRAPQESNKPYPTTKFLPIKMNLENELVREANLPPIIYQIVVGGGSIIPDEGQPLDIVGWYPNGTVAIGIVPYGHGKIIMSNPHPNITGSDAEFWRNSIMTNHARRWGWSDKMIAKGEELMKTNKDLDGPKPDQELSKAMLSYAYKKASY
jgi:glutamine amidotransferase-like uncharacterized protein